MTIRKRGLKILIVDDDVSVRKTLNYMLGGRNFIVQEAVNGKEALERVAQDKPDIIILDVAMPEMNGVEACRRLRKNPETKDIPIIFFSGQKSMTGVSRDIPGGTVDCVEKPNVRDLLKRIDKIMVDFLKAAE